MEQLGVIAYARQTIECLCYRDLILPWGRLRGTFIERPDDQDSFPALRHSEVSSIESFRRSELVSRISQAPEYAFAQRVESWLQQAGNVLNAEGARSQVDHQVDEHFQ